MKRPNNHPLKSWNALFAILATGGLLAGCVHKEYEPAYIPNVAATQNNEGLVTISWPSREGYNYRLVARTEGKVIMDSKVYRGTGEDIVIQFMRDRSKPLPDYSVKPEKISKR